MAPSSVSTIVPIPEPPGLPLIGNLTELKSEDSLKDLSRLHDIYGEIYRLRFPGRKTYIFLATHKLVDEICDESRFAKSLKSELSEVRLAVHDGLFTAHNHEENWGIAHRILMPAFGPVAIKGMFDEMYDIATQLALKWARHGPSQPIAASEEFTRLALDTLALCSMHFRFNSFYKETLHPFVQSMADTLTEAGKRYSRPSWVRIFNRAAKRKLFDDIALMRKTAENVINTRRANPSGYLGKDLLTAMVDGVDPKMVKKMTDQTTPQAAQKEVDEIMGRHPITVEKIFKLKYIPAVLRETLRQCSPIPGIKVEPLEDTLLAGKYPVKKGDSIFAFFSKSHLDPVVFGEDKNEFKPERMMDDNFNRLQKEFRNCWKPFGNGMRACIGRPFAWQEMLLAIAILLQNFNFYMDDPGYTLRLSETLTIKPKDFNIRASLRHGIDTCKALANQLAADASVHGFYASVVDSLDTTKENLPTGYPVIIFTSSYEGQPPDNARQFVAWLESLTGKEADKVPYAVFGVRNREWAHTFHRVPKLIDAALRQHGAERVADTGLADVSDRDVFNCFEIWEYEILWPALEKKYPASMTGDLTEQKGLSVQITVPRPSTLRQNVQEAIVTAAQDLTPLGAPRKRHIEIKLQAGTSYCTGDSLAMLPMNPPDTVRRVFRRFKISWDAALTVEGDKGISLPADRPTSAWDVLRGYVELTQPATKRNILALVDCSLDPNTRKQLEELGGDKFHEEINKTRVSVLDLLEQYPSIELQFSSFLSMLPPMCTRQYSISSSPLNDPDHVRLTYSLLDDPSFSGLGQYVGVASNYLANLEPDDLHVAVRPSHVAFHLPSAPESTPIICIAAGSGIAPFRGFIQVRSAQIAAGRALTPALLFYGCRGRGEDVYRDEFNKWEATEAVSVKRAYSRETPDETIGCKYVQVRLVKEKESVFRLWDQGAKLFVCGSRKLGSAVEEACLELIKELKDINDEGAKRFMETIRNDRYTMDVFD
ncbi:cytochrome P450 [Dactylonectria macrodidyma]|uniref:Cytochrome P450 n=1 Tax=Dactylonectria macrodidyma TaxID=307937 RepID=A0A9P9FTK0_9HYPO|nr:cytochrome P450 [Dactylonectria macrodidyma]